MGGDAGREAIPLPGSGSVESAALGPAVGAWVRSWAMRDLAELSGWRWPGIGSDRELAHALVALSTDWDFRGRAAAAARTGFVERSSMPAAAPLVLSGREADPDRVVAAARALRLVDSRLQPEFVPTRVVVLSGTARANVNRTHFAADVLSKGGYRPAAVVGLTAHRELGEAERASCRELGMQPTDSEWTTLRDALVDAFGLDGGELVTESAPDAGSWVQRFKRSATLRWTSGPTPVELLVVPASTTNDESPRPATTADQIRWWAAAPSGPTPADAVLLVTTQIYVPYQQLVAAQVLRTAAPGCRLLTVGVDAATAVVPTRAFTAQDYLQEVRSALVVAAELLDDLAG